MKIVVKDINKLPRIEGFSLYVSNGYIYGNEARYTKNNKVVVSVKNSKVKLGCKSTDAIKIIMKLARKNLICEENKLRAK